MCVCVCVCVCVCMCVYACVHLCVCVCYMLPFPQAWIKFFMDEINDIRLQYNQ